MKAVWHDNWLLKYMPANKLSELMELTDDDVYN